MTDTSEFEAGFNVSAKKGHKVRERQDKSSALKRICQPSRSAAARPGLRGISRIHRQDRASDVVGFGQPAQRAATRNTLTLFGGKALREFGIHEAGRDRVHGDSELADLA